MNTSGHPASTPQKHDIFISYSRKDKYFVEFLEKVFNYFHIPVWVDHIFLGGGDKFPDMIENKILSSSAVLLLWSKDAALSDWVKKEILMAGREEKKLIPCVLDDTALPPEISDLNHVDFRENVEDAVRILFNSLGIAFASTPVLKEYLNILFEKIIAVKTGTETPHEMKIPGMHLRIFDNKLIRWKNQAFSTNLGVTVLKRKFLYTNYGNELLSLFRKYLKEHGWQEISGASDHYSELTYRILSVNRRENTVFAYIFTAQQKDDDWDSQLYVLDADHVTFFDNLIRWISGKSQDAVLLCDDFIVNIYDAPREKEYYNSKYQASLSFYCELGRETKYQGIHWFEQILDVFIDFLEKNEYQVNDIGVKKRPLVAIYPPGFVPSAQWDVFLFEAIPVNASGKPFKFLFESECNPKRTQGYSKISVILSP